MILIDCCQEADAAPDAFRFLSGHAGLPSALQADGDIESLVAVSLQVFDGLVPADLYAADKFHAHLAQDIDFRFDHVFFQTEGRDAVEQHAAGPGFLIKNSDIIAAGTQIVGCRQARGACADDCHLVVRTPHAAVVFLTDGDKTLFGVQFLIGDELFDLVNGDRIIHGSPGTGVLTAPVADRAADRRERIILLDQFEGVHKAALSRHADVTLYRQMGRAGSFAGRCAGIITVDLGILPVIGIPVVRAPGCLIRKQGRRIADLSLGRAKLLSQFGGAYRANFDAFAAGDAFFFVHVGTVGTAGHIGGIVKLAGTESVADTGGAVADGDDLFLSVDICDLVDKAVALRPFQDFQGFFIADVAAHASVDTVLRHVADAHTEFAVDLAGAFPAHGLLLAAGTLAHRIFVILIEPVGNVFHAGGEVLMLDGLFHGNDVHAYAGASRRNHGSDVFQGHLSHQIEEGGQLRMLSCQLIIHHHKFRGTRYEDGHIVLLVMVFILPVHFDHADPDQMVHHLFGVLVRHLVDFSQLFNIIGLAGLLEAQKEFGLFLGQYFVQHPVLRIIGIHGTGILDQIPVRDHGPQLQDQFLFLIVRRNVMRILSEIPLVDHTILLVFHADLPYVFEYFCLSLDIFVCLWMFMFVFGCSCSKMNQKSDSRFILMFENEPEIK